MFYAVIGNNSNTSYDNIELTIIYPFFYESRVQMMRERINPPTLMKLIAAVATAIKQQKVKRIIICMKLLQFFLLNNSDNKKKSIVVENRFCSLFLVKKYIIALICFD